MSSFCNFMPSNTAHSSFSPLPSSPTALPFLSNTEVFLFPIASVVFLYIFNLVGHPFGLGFNGSRVMAYLYFE